MSETVKDGNKIEELLTRGVEEIIDHKELASELLSGKKLRIKLGIDPTSPNIHIGRAVLLWKLRAFQELGHKTIFIVGDFTARIGDTSDKDAERPMLSELEVKKNMANYFHQAYKILDKEMTEVHFNSEWLGKLGFLEIAKMANLFGLHEFESRDVISRRLKEGKRVSLQELLYPLMQGYDSVEVKADVEIGGRDQRFNLLAGRAIQPFYGQKPQNILMTELLEGTDGRKMSSSWGNVVNITDSPDDMYGKIMAINDDLMIKYFKLATRVPISEISQLEAELKNGANPKNIKARLGFETVKLYYGEEAAIKAGREWENVFSKKEIPSDISEWPGGDIISVLTGSGAASSKTEAKRLIEQKAVKVINKGEEKAVDSWDFEPEPGTVLKIGSHKFLKIK